MGHAVFSAKSKQTLNVQMYFKIVFYQVVPLTITLQFSPISIPDLLYLPFPEQYRCAASLSLPYRQEPGESIGAHILSN